MFKMKPNMYGAGEREEGGCQTRSSHFLICFQVISVIPRTMPGQCVAASGQLPALDATPKFPNIPVSLQGNTEIPGTQLDEGPETP